MKKDNSNAGERSALGLVEADGVEEMEAFDALPREVREAVNYAVGEYSALQIAGQDLAPSVQGKVLMLKANDALKAIGELDRRHPGYRRALAVARRMNIPPETIEHFRRMIR